MKSDSFSAEEIVNNIDFDEIKKHPNILIAARFWKPERYHAAKACYKFMRKIDDLIDNRKAESPNLNECEKVLYTNQINEWMNCLGMIGNIDPEFGEIADTVNQFKLPIQLFNNFAQSMLFDIDHNGFETYHQFVKYSEGASVAPASVFVHLCCLNSEDKPYAIPALDVIKAARPCAMFSYIVHIIRDFQVDQNNNLNYFANDLLAQNQLTISDLQLAATKAQIPKNFRKVIAFYMQKAEQYKQQTLATINSLAPYLEPRYLLSLEIIFNLYLQVYERIDVARGNFTTKELNPTPSEMKAMVQKVIQKVLAMGNL